MDSKVTLYWIQSNNHEWKQFVGNQVASIRAIVPSSNWYHCPGRKNPANNSSRGMMPSELSQNSLWRSGPVWLQTLQEITESPDSKLDIPRECQEKLEARGVANLLTDLQIAQGTECLRAIINMYLAKIQGHDSHI